MSSTTSSALPTAAVDAGSGATSSVAAGRAPLTVSLPALSGSAIRAASPPPPNLQLRARNLAARQRAYVTSTRADIAALKPGAADYAVYTTAMTDVAQLIQIWYNGAQQAVEQFRTALVPGDQRSQEIAKFGLAANLGWAIVALAEPEMAGWIAVQQAVIGLVWPSGASPAYRQKMTNTTALLNSRLNAIYSRLNGYSDVAAFATVKRIGFAAFAALDHVDQEKALWSAFFGVQPAGADQQGFQEAIVVAVTDALAKTDARAVAHLARLGDIWRASLRPVSIPSGGPGPQITLFDADLGRWTGMTRDPMWEYTCLPSPPAGMGAFDADDPCPTPAKRAAILLAAAVMHVSPFADILSGAIKNAPGGP